MANICVIPARAGSKGIPGKNIKDFCGMPLIYWSIEAAKRSEYIDRIIVSTDGQDIRDVALSFGAEVRDRPKELAEDDVHSIHVVLDVIDTYKLADDDVVCMLLPTAPLRPAKDVKDAIDVFNPRLFDSLVGVCQANHTPSSYRYIDGPHLIPAMATDYEAQRQQAAKLYCVNGAMFISTAGNLAKVKSFHRGDIQPFIMEKSRSIDINDEFDWEVARTIVEMKK